MLHNFNKILNRFYKEDSSFEIEGLDGFPGPFVKFTNQWLKGEGYIRLMRGIENRRAIWHNVLTYADTNGLVKSFSSKTEGSIAMKVSEHEVPESNWEADRVWVPNGFNVPIAELDKETRKTKVWKRNKLKNFMVWYLKHSNKSK